MIGIIIRITATTHIHTHSCTRRVRLFVFVCLSVYHSSSLAPVIVIVIACYVRSSFRLANQISALPSGYHYITLSMYSGAHAV